MKILAFSGSYRKGKTIDTLIDKAIEGVMKVKPDANVQKIRLVEKKIEYCRNCMTCRNDDPAKEIAKCIIQDDMQEMHTLMNDADAYIFGTPIQCADASAVMHTFIERVAWVMGRPGDTFPVKGCPVPRNPRKKKAIIIVSSGIVPPLFRHFCDTATSYLKAMCECDLNATTVGSMYAGDIDTLGVEHYYGEAVKLGEKLAR